MPVALAVELETTRRGNSGRLSESSRYGARSGDVWRDGGVNEQESLFEFQTAANRGP